MYRWANAEQTLITDDAGTAIPAVPGNRHYDDILASGASISGFTSPAVNAGDVNRERDRRMALFTFQGKAYDFDPDSQTNIAGAGTLAFAAIVNGKQPGDLRWADADRDFGWIAHDNTVTLMDAPTCFAFATAAANYKSALIFKARTIKNLSPIPADYADDARWT